MKKNEVKLLAVIGGSAIVTLGVLGVAVDQRQPSLGFVASTGVTTAVTRTAAHPPTAPETPVATPPIKGPAPLPPEEQGLPG